MLYGSECWALATADVQQLQRNESAMIGWICKVKIRDKISSDSLLNKLCLKNLDITLRSNRLHWFGHVFPAMVGNAHSLKWLANENMADLEKLGNSALTVT